MSISVLSVLKLNKPFEYHIAVTIGLVSKSFLNATRGRAVRREIKHSTKKIMEDDPDEDDRGMNNTLRDAFEFPA